MHHKRDIHEEAFQLRDTHDAIRRKAFEEAVEIQPVLRRPGAWATPDYKAGYDTAMKDKAAAIRALAKEKP